MIPIEPGIKIAFQAPPEPTQDEIDFIRRMGIEYVVLWARADKVSAAYYASRKALYAENGIQVYGFGNTDVHNQDAIVLGLPGRDAKIEEYKQHIRNLGQAGIPYTTYAHMANGIWSTDREPTRGGAMARGFDLDRAQAGHWAGRRYEMPLTHDRTYSEDEIWANYEYFIKQVVPVAEQAGVRIGIHPDDPPVPELGGIPRCIFSSFDGYKRALEIADSPNVGMCLCVGCWLEGGDGMGKNVLETIHYFGGLGKLFKVHLRNVDQPLPHFVETFLDSGYMDLYQVVKTLRDVDFDGVMIPDHIPMMDDDHRVGSAYSIGYMKALLERANQEHSR
ncbi:MAG: mannonate dehydratase [Anaerolineae bacterium]|nr:mannonate dehydratase [Anaerolineae bacterium]